MISSGETLGGLATVEAPLALLAEPSGPDDGGDPDVGPGVVVVLETSRAGH